MFCNIVASAEEGAPLKAAQNDCNVAFQANPTPVAAPGTNPLILGVLPGPVATVCAAYPGRLRITR
jgi:hypothetical protein